MTTRRQIVGILGTGNFATALAKRLYFSGYDVIVGSRRPEETSILLERECPCNMNLVSTKECITTASIIFLAIHVEHFKDLLKDCIDLFNGKVVVDVSNRDKPSRTHSNSEYLQTIIPSASVVKAFNIISAYTMENDYVTNNRQVFIAGNDSVAKETVANIARGMGFTPVDFGSLIIARRIEKHPLLLFPGWRGPIIFSLVVFIVWLLFLTYIYYIEKTVYEWEQIFVKVLNKAICMTGISVLSVTYLASSFAGLTQIYHGTKHRRFPRWLDKWLKCRKQLGLVSYILVAMHVMMSILIMSPTYLRSWYHSTIVVIPNNLSEVYKYNNINWMTWKGEAACLTGILSFVLLTLICVSTLPSVTNTLNWQEWRFIQSKVGHTALGLAIVHVLVMGIPGWYKNPKAVYKSITFLSSIVPWITVLVKLILTLPCIDGYLIKIRKGWVRKEKRCKCDHSNHDGCIKPCLNRNKIGNKTRNKAERTCQYQDTVHMVNITDTDCACNNDS